MDYTKWETMTGETLNISDMSTLHILRCIAMIEHSEHREPIISDEPVYFVDYEQNKPYLEVFRKELERRKGV